MFDRSSGLGDPPRMANLLGRSSPSRRTADFDPAEQERIDARRAQLERLREAGRLADANARLAELAPELDELDAAPDLVAAAALLESIESLRAAVVRELAPPEACAPARRAGPGRDRAASASAAVDAFVCHRPGRSLATGEAEIASRGFFDGVDRPPIVGWIGVIELGQGLRGRAAQDDFAIVAWVAPEDRERAQAGVRACASGALGWLSELVPVASRALGERDDAVRASGSAASRAPESGVDARDRRS